MIETRRLVLRWFRDDDLDAFSAVLRDPKTMAAWGGPYSAERATAELRHYLDHYERYGFGPYAALEGDVIVGDVGLQHLEGGPQVELLYRLSSSVWGRGLATEACDAVLNSGFGDLMLPEIVAVIAENNLASQHLAAKLGFIAGDLGTYYGHRLVRHHITADLHARSVAVRKPSRRN
jgi:RimJ/RimL family protein N-acetyltransferase